MEDVTDGSQCRLATTDDFLAIAETVTGKTLGWFFEVYLRQLGIPRLSAATVGDTLYLKWYIENDIPFPLPVAVLLGTDTVRVDMSGGAGRVAVPPGVTPVIDPANWLLKTTIPAFSASKTVCSFGAITVDSSKIDSVTITNTWATTLNISSAAADLADYTVSPPAAAIPAGASLKFYVTFTPSTAGNKLGHVNFAHDAPGSPLSIIVAGSGVMPSFSYDVSARWNIVSVPLAKADPRKVVLFPTATSPAYEYSTGTGYVARDSLRPGVGYWLKFGSDQSVTMAGIPVAVETVEVKAGWNLVGSIGGPMPVASIVAEPPEMTVVGFFDYTLSYARVDTIRPSRGYWVKVDRDGKLIFSTAGPAEPGESLRTVPSSGSPPPPRRD